MIMLYVKQTQTVLELCNMRDGVCHCEYLNHNHLSSLHKRHIKHNAKKIYQCVNIVMKYVICYFLFVYLFSVVYANSYCHLTNIDI